MKKEEEIKAGSEGARKIGGTERGKRGEEKGRKEMNK